MDFTQSCSGSKTLGKVRKNEVKKVTLEDWGLLQNARMTLMHAQISSCSCLTKTPELQYHAELCKYRLIGVAVDDIITVLKNNQEIKNGD